MGAVPAGTEPAPNTVSAGAAPHDELLGVAQAAASGDADAAATLVLQLGGGMLRVIRKVFGAGYADIDDVAQEATLALLSALTTFRGESSVSHFANRVTLLTALGARRKTRALMRKAEEDAKPLDDVATSAASPHEEMLSLRRRQLVRELLDELSEPVAEAMALHFMLGHSVDEIADDLEVSPHTIWSRLRLGKQALRRKLERNGRLKEALESSSEEGDE